MYFPWNPSLAKADLYITRLTRPCMIWLAIETLISTASTLPLAHSPPATLSWEIPGMLPVQSLSINHSLCLECSLPEPHIQLPHFLQAFIQTPPYCRAPCDPVEMSMCPAPCALPQLYPCSSMCHHQKSIFLTHFVAHLPPSLEHQLHERRDLHLFHSLLLIQ